MNGLVDFGSQEVRPSKTCPGAREPRHDMCVRQLVHHAGVLAFSSEKA